MAKLDQNIGITMNTNGMLIAETNEQGEIVCVWQANHGHRPKPVKDAAACLSAFGSFGTFGAPREAIMLWLTHSVEQKT
ncbi:hypothetical protein E4191_22800 (plasmid) [Paracoccus liaowanqingii]|uniref:Uncharacterized protein n=1 Tax=Paracoccus liaowanqingii TaxID=2560053 RepID=A0A4Y5SVV5_9RHOB|nr:hypothetical protein [Paracoccus liaowanqingii]QDA36884.1 hypothetical protein E4191_22800 [Paracoccus liaowanqingii]